MADESDPPRKFYQLKPKEFERVNDVSAPPGPLAVPPPSALPLADTTPPIAADTAPPIPVAPSAPITVHQLARQAIPDTDAPFLQRSPGPAPTSEVHGILRENLNRANQAGANDLAPMPKRSNRRMRDFLVIIIPLNAFFAFWAFGPYSGPITFAYGIGGMAVVTAGLAWVMFGVMDRY